MRALILLLGIAVVVAAYFTFANRDRSPVERMQPPADEAAVQSTVLPKLWQVPDFKLTERSGSPLTLSDLKGNVWLADFFYTSCPGPCPMLSSRLSDVQKAIGNAKDIRLVSVSTDPEKDTVDTLNGYATQFGAGPHWFFLTGDKAEIYKLANQGFKLSVTEDRSAAEPITHSTRIALVDRQGVVRGFYDGTDPQKLPQMIQDIHKLLEERQ
jgi:protein SCO1/2